MDTPAFIPIANVVNSYLNVTDNYSDRNYRRLLQVVCENYTDLNIHSTGRLKQIAMTISANNTIILPVDCIDYVRIGVKVNGQMFCVTRNDKILLPDTVECGADVADTDLTDPLDLNVWPSYGSSRGVKFLFYRVDKYDPRIIVFKGDGVGRTIYLQYISSGVSLSGETLIPVQLLLPMRSYLHWTLLSFDRQASDVEVRRAERTFKKQLGEYERLENGFTLEEFLDAMRQSYRQTIKY